jgi:hypothetical protein
LEKIDDYYYQYALYHTISDFADLSITEIIILQFLARYSEPVVRHVLFTEVKQFIEFREQKSPVKLEDNHHSHKFQEFINVPKKLSTGKFYYSLDKLEKRGLLTYNGTTGKVSINPTDYTKFIPKLLLKFLINNNVMESTEYRENFFKKFLDKVENQTFNRVLCIWLSEYVPLSILNQISSFSNEIYILSKNEINHSKPVINKGKFRYSEIVGGLFREREDFFDATFIPVYKKTPKFYGMTRNKLLQEVMRVTKPNGYIILITVADFEMTDNIFINELIKLYKAALINRIYTYDDLYKEMNNNRLKNIDIFEHQGFLIGIAINSV